MTFDENACVIVCTVFIWVLHFLVSLCFYLAFSATETRYRYLLVLGQFIAGLFSVFHIPNKVNWIEIWNMCFDLVSWIVLSSDSNRESPPRVRLVRAKLVNQFVFLIHIKDTCGGCQMLGFKLSVQVLESLRLGWSFYWIKWFESRFTSCQILSICVLLDCRTTCSSGHYSTVIEHWSHLDDVPIDTLLENHGVVATTRWSNHPVMITTQTTSSSDHYSMTIDCRTTSSQ